MQLTSKIDRIVAKNGVNAINKSKSNSYIEEPYPIGVKFNMYRELIDAENQNRKGGWDSIYKQMLKKPSDEGQSFIRQIIQSHNKQKQFLHRVEENLQRGEPINKKDLENEANITVRNRQ